MPLNHITVTLMYRPGPGLVTVTTADAWGSSSGTYVVGVGFDLRKHGSEKAKEFGRLLKWVLRNDPDCDSEMWSQSLRWA
jgi:hypothetical protein